MINHRTDIEVCKKNVLFKEINKIAKIDFFFLNKKYHFYTFIESRNNKQL